MIKSKKLIWLEVQSEVDKWDFLEIKDKYYISLDDLKKEICDMIKLYEDGEIKDEFDITTKKESLTKSSRKDK